MGSLIIIFEVNRQAAIKEVKALDVKSEWLAVKLSLEELQREVALQQQDIDRLHRVLLDLTASPPSPAPTPHTPSGSSVSHRSNVHPPHIPKVPHSLHKSLIPVTPHIPDGAHASPVPRLQNKPQNTRKPPQVPPPRVPHAPLDSHTHHSSPRDSRT
ncbi:putative uncharacterized protein DDB_G0291608 [Colias croceus]|uniref:putative uncharacterized protein DDB_G0291608 n=1 Tax=Colias crocea TaxID=72248 RepID=UPI001E28150E|nr:putative uncharacterized protein DDB_G0291608 [Colias croceus]